MLKGRGGDGSVARQLQRFAADKFAPVSLEEDPGGVFWTVYPSGDPVYRVAAGRVLCSYGRSCERR